LTGRLALRPGNPQFAKIWRNPPGSWRKSRTGTAQTPVAPPQWAAVPLSRIAWLSTVTLAVVTGVVLLLDGYTGYGILAFVVGASAAINLR
jgi:hypothetical protein